MVDYIIEEPTFDATHTRCYKLPFNTCEALCQDTEFIREKVLFPPKDLKEENRMDISTEDCDRDVLLKLFSFVTLQ